MSEELKKIMYRCPSCNRQSLFIDSRGSLTCGVIGCKNPTAFTDIVEELLDNNPEPKSHPTQDVEPKCVDLDEFNKIMNKIFYYIADTEISTSKIDNEILKCTAEKAKEEILNFIKSQWLKTSEVERVESFESFLQDYHCKENPCILDDDLPDAFDDWISNLDCDDWIDLAERWGKKCWLKTSQGVSVEDIKYATLEFFTEQINKHSDGTEQFSFTIRRNHIDFCNELSKAIKQRIDGR